MRNNKPSPQEMLHHAKETLAASHESAALTVALLDISAALDDWLGIGASRPRFRARPRRYDINNYREMPEYKAMREQEPARHLEGKLRQLRREGTISLEESYHIERMREERNAAAHGRRPDVTYEDIKRYGELVEDIVTGNRKPGKKTGNAAKYNAQQSSRNTEKAVSSSTMSSSSPKQEPRVPPSQSAVQHLPAEVAPPIASQADSNIAFLAQLLEIEIGDK